MTSRSSNVEWEMLSLERCVFSVLIPHSTEALALATASISSIMRSTCGCASWWWVKICCHSVTGFFKWDNLWDQAFWESAILSGPYQVKTCENQDCYLDFWYSILQIRCVPLCMIGNSEGPEQRIIEWIHPLSKMAGNWWNELRIRSTAFFPLATLLSVNDSFTIVTSFSALFLCSHSSDSILWILKFGGRFIASAVISTWRPSSFCVDGKGKSLSVSSKEFKLYTVDLTASITVVTIKWHTMILCNVGQMACFFQCETIEVHWCQVAIKSSKWFRYPRNFAFWSGLQDLLLLLIMFSANRHSGKKLTIIVFML